MTRETQRKLVLPALLLVLACVQAVNAQDGQQSPQPSPTPLTAPPPFKMIVKEERDQIEQTHGFIKATQTHDQFRRRTSDGRRTAHSARKLRGGFGGSRHVSRADRKRFEVSQHVQARQQQNP